MVLAFAIAAIFLLEYSKSEKELISSKIKLVYALFFMSWGINRVMKTIGISLIFLGQALDFGQKYVE